MPVLETNPRLVLDAQSSLPCFLLFLSFFLSLSLSLSFFFFFFT